MYGYGDTLKLKALYYYFYHLRVCLRINYNDRTDYDDRANYNDQNMNEMKKLIWYNDDSNNTNNNNMNNNDNDDNSFDLIVNDRHDCRKLSLRCI